MLPLKESKSRKTQTNITTFTATTAIATIKFKEAVRIVLQDKILFYYKSALPKFDTNNIGLIGSGSM